VDRRDCCRGYLQSRPRLRRAGLKESWNHDFRNLSEHTQPLFVSICFRILFAYRCVLRICVIRSNLSCT
jgi:hypothetical protein